MEELEGKRTLSPRTKQEASAGGLRLSLSEDGGGSALGGQKWVEGRCGGVPRELKEETPDRRA